MNIPEGTFGIISFVVSVVSITLAIVSIYLARLSVRESQANFEKTSEVLSKINERTAGTEKVVGDHFDKLMGTVLSIVNTATANPEVRKAELEAQKAERGVKSQEMFTKMLQDAVTSGDTTKVDRFLESFKKMGEVFGTSRKS